MRTCDNCQTRMAPYVPRKKVSGQYLCPACVRSDRGGYVSASKTARPEAVRLWPQHPLFRPGDKVLETTGNGNQYPATVHHQEESTDPDHPGTVWIDAERHGIGGEIGIHPSRLEPHPDAPAEQHEHYRQQKALNDAGVPYVPQAERNIDESDRITVHHLTDRHDFALDSTLRPQLNTTMGGSLSPRLFVGNPTSWAEGEHHYRRPYVAEMTAPRGAVLSRGGYLGEKEIPGRHFDKVQVTRVIPYSEHRREEQDPGYRSPVDTRTWSEQQHRDLLKSHREHLHTEHGWGWNEFDENHNHVGLDEEDWDEHMPDPNSGYPGTYVRRDKQGRPMTQVRSSLETKTAGIFGPEWYETARDEDIDAHPFAESIRSEMTTHVSPQGHVYRLTHDPSRYVHATYLGKGENRVKNPQIVGALTYFGGKANPEESNIQGRIHKVFVKPAHRRRGLASAMLDHARAMKDPNDDIEHSNALSDDGKAWSGAKASLTTTSLLEADMNIKIALTAVNTGQRIIVVAHDSGDGETIYHCPFCGSGQVIARSDRTIECEFCHTCFTVQVQPQFAAFPQTIDGQPVDVPGMPGQIGAPAPAGPPVGPDGAPMDDSQDPGAGAPPFGGDGQSDDADPEGEGEDTEDDDDDKPGANGGNPFAKGSMRATAGVCSGSGERKNVSRSSMRSKEPGSQAKVADISCSECGRRFTTRANDKTREATVPRHSEGKTSSLRNGNGAAMSPEAYMRHLALKHTDDREATLALIRASRG